MSLSMITDRTEASVAVAKSLLLKAQSGQTLTAEEISAIEKGICSITMLNRVENAQKELAETLNSMNYSVSIENKNWTYAEIFSYMDYLRIIGNLNKLKNAYYVLSTTPRTPTYIYGWNEANAIEKILVDIESVINDMKSKYRECGTFNCGEENEK